MDISALNIEIIENARFLRAEVVAAELVLNQPEGKNDHIFLNQGALKRPFRGEIASISQEQNELLGLDYLVIALNKEGLYDYLPEGLFHQPRKLDSFKSKQQTLEEIKQVRQQEKEARNFFSPFENEFQHLRLGLELLERKMVFGLPDEVWESGKEDGRASNFFNESSSLFFLLPLAYHVNSDPELVGEVISLIIGEKVKIEFKQAKLVLIENNEDRRIGEITLGFSSPPTTGWPSGITDWWANKTCMTTACACPSS